MHIVFDNGRPKWRGRRGQRRRTRTTIIRQPLVTFAFLPIPNWPRGVG